MDVPKEFIGNPEKVMTSDLGSTTMTPKQRKERRGKKLIFLSLGRVSLLAAKRQIRVVIKDEQNVKVITT